jgi:hypothetical protein
MLRTELERWVRMKNQEDVHIFRAQHGFGLMSRLRRIQNGARLFDYILSIGRALISTSYIVHVCCEQVFHSVQLLLERIHAGKMQN